MSLESGVKIPPSEHALNLSLRKRTTYIFTSLPQAAVQCAENGTEPLASKTNRF